MAEAFFEKYAKSGIARSAGYSPGYWVGRNLDMTKYVKVCMDEDGIDVRKKISKRIEPERVEWADKVIVFDSKREDWPDFLRESDKVEVWEVDDPRHGDLETHRKTRDEIKEKMLNFLKAYKSL